MTNEANLVITHHG